MTTTPDLSHLDGAQRITEERHRQQAMGWSRDHDREHDKSELLAAAHCYLAAARFSWPLEAARIPTSWPFEADAWHPDPDPVRNLEKAGALIAAEIDRRTAS